MTRTLQGTPIAAPSWQPRTADCYWREAQRVAFLAREAFERQSDMQVCRQLFAAIALAPFLMACWLLATSSDRAYHSLAEPVRLAIAFAPTVILLAIAAACHYAMGRAHDAYLVLNALLEERLSVMETTRDIVATIEEETAAAVASGDAARKLDLRVPRSAVPRVFHASASLAESAETGHLNWHARRQVALRQAKG